ncbi:MAG: glycosyltransferase [Hydrogenophaga sp.]|nr:glycosyltransferase [Hydrogenophaga sp.]
MQSVNVLCIKWGKKYGPEYVNRLHNMVRRHLHRPFRFVCLTDDAQGIDPGIEVKPIPPIGFDEFDQRKPWTFGHGWLKLTSFAKPLYDLEGRTLFLDLDIVIVDSLDPFFDQPGEFVVIKEWDKKDGTGNTSVYLFTVGAHVDALDHLRNGYPKVVEEVRNEQEFITGYLGRQGKVSYWPEEWCRSFKRHCMRRGIMGWFAPPVIPPGARVIAFHGKPNPPDAIAGISGKWYRRVLPTAWVAEHWR